MLVDSRKFPSRNPHDLLLQAREVVVDLTVVFANCHHTH